MGTGRKAPPDEVITELYSQGLSMTDIGRRFGVTFRAIQKHVHRMGLKRVIVPKPIDEEALIEEDIQKIRVEYESWKQLKIRELRKYQDWVYCQNGDCKNKKKHDPATMTIVRTGSKRIGQLKYCSECYGKISNKN